MHEAIRRHSVDAAKAIKLDGADNDLLKRIESDPIFKLTKEEIDEIVDVKAFTGRAEKQVEEYVSEVVDPLLEKNAKDAIETGAVTV